MNWRSEKLLVAVRTLPCTWPLPHQCMHGTVVAGHSNQLRDGKGKGIKAHDYRVAALCFTAHHECDQGSQLNKQERLDAWEDAHRATVGLMFERGIVRFA